MKVLRIYFVSTCIYNRLLERDFHESCYNHDMSSHISSPLLFCWDIYRNTGHYMLENIFSNVKHFSKWKYKANFYVTYELCLIKPFLFLWNLFKLWLTIYYIWNYTTVHLNVLMLTKLWHPFNNAKSLSMLLKLECDFKEYVNSLSIITFPISCTITFAIFFHPNST
jgi:hypothetical protein